MSFDQSFRRLNHQRIDLFRKLKLRLSVFLFGPFSKFCENSAQHNILVLRMDDKVGDSVAATGFLRELKKAHPQSQLIVVSGAVSAELYRNLEFVDSVIKIKKGIFSTLGVFNLLRGQKYQFIINTSHILNPRVIFLTSFLAASKKISFANQSCRVFSDFVEIDFKNDHITDRYKKTLNLAGISTNNLDYVIKLDEKDIYQAETALYEIRQHSKYVIALNSFAGGKLRNFSKKTTFEIVNALLENKDVTVVSLANKGDHEILDLWTDVIVNERWVHFEEISGLSQNMALASLCDVIITPDTAWVHVASALKKNLVSVFREDDNPEEVNSRIWAPFGIKAKIIFAPKTSAISDVNSVDPKAVAKAALDFIS